MKKTIIALGMAASLSSYGQGCFIMGNMSQNSGAGAPVTISDPGQADDGYFVGSDFTVSLYWAAGTITDLATFNAAAAQVTAADAVFYGVTGTAPDHGPLVDGAGLFDGGAPVVPGAGMAATITVEYRVWQTGTGVTGFGNALVRGVSGLNQVALVDPSGTSGANTVDSLQPFTVAPVPEPGTFALAGLGTAALLIFRRRK